jgi:hypothetical protein
VDPDPGARYLRNFSGKNALSGSETLDYELTPVLDPAKKVSNPYGSGSTALTGSGTRICKIFVFIPVILELKDKFIELCTGFNCSNCDCNDFFAVRTQILCIRNYWFLIQIRLRP